MRDWLDIIGLAFAPYVPWGSLTRVRAERASTAVLGDERATRRKIGR